MIPSPTLRGTLFPPIAIGLGYAAAQAIGKGAAWGGLYWQSPFMFAFLAGLIMALALRPVMVRVPWRRGTAFAAAAAMLLGMGPVASWCEAWLGRAVGAAPFPIMLPPSAVPELLGLVMAAGLMGGLFRPHGGEIGLESLRARLGRYAPGAWALRLGGFSLAALATLYAAGALAEWWAETFLLPPLLDPNPWSRLAGADGTGGRALLFLLGWLRAGALVLPLLPVALVLRGTPMQVSLVFALLLFVIGAFAPLVEDQPFPSPGWLAGRVALDALQSAFIGWVGARLIGQIRLPVRTG